MTGWVTPPGPAFPRDDDPLYGGAAVSEQDDLFGDGTPKVKLRLGYIKVVGADGAQLIDSRPETDHLIGAELDYWAARAINAQFVEIVGDHTCFADYRAAERAERGVPFAGGDEQLAGVFQPSTDWRPGGYIIERHKIGVARHEGEWYADMEMLERKEGSSAEYAYGPTPLIAAMRCLVRSVYGAEAPAIYPACDLEHRPDPNVKFWRDDPVQAQAAREDDYRNFPHERERWIAFDHACALIDNELMTATDRTGD